MNLSFLYKTLSTPFEEFEEKYEEFEDKIWRNTSIHSVIPFFTMNESINK